MPKYTELVVAAATSDPHFRDRNKEPSRYLSPEKNKELFEYMATLAPAIIIAGDFIDRGGEKSVIVAEAKTAAWALRDIAVPKVAVLGNHDLHGDAGEVVQKILHDEAGVVVLQGSVYNYSVEGKNIAVAGTKGMGGGFYEAMLPDFGEEKYRELRREIDDENYFLNKAISEVKEAVDAIIVVTHYAPVIAVVAPERPEIWPFMGNSGIEEVIDAHKDKVIAAVSGHADSGGMAGKTRGGVDVFNGSIPARLKAHGVDRENPDLDKLFVILRTFFQASEE